MAETNVFDAPSREVRHFIKPLPCVLDEADYARLGRDLARVLDELDSAIAREESLKREMKARIAEIEARRSAIAHRLRSGTEDRDVTVSVRLTEAGVATEIRIDTGEVLLTRPALASETQLALELDASEGQCAANSVVSGKERGA